MSATMNRQIYPYQEVIEHSRITSASLDTVGAFTFSLDLLNGALRLATLYDSYRIKKVNVEFSPVGVQEVVSAYSNVGQNVPMLYTAVDFNDATSPANLAEIQQYSTLTSCLATQPQRIVLTPRHLVMIYNGLSSTAYALGDASSWLSTTNRTIPHYGIKWVFTADSGSSLASRFSYLVRMKFYLEFCKRK
jgi:hypothetical protein